MTPSSTGSTGPDFPGTHLLPHVICTSLDTFCTCLRFAIKIPNCTKSEYIHASPKTAVGCHLPSHPHISGIFIPRSQPSHCTCHTSHLCMLSSRASYSLSWISPANKLYFASSLQHAGCYSFLISEKTMGNCRSSHFLLETMVDVPGETPGDTWWLLLSVLLTFKIKYYFIIMQTKSTSLQGVFVMNVGEMTYMKWIKLQTHITQFSGSLLCILSRNERKCRHVPDKKINTCNTRKRDFLE